MTTVTNVTPNEILELLKNDRNSEEITLFHLTHPEVVIQSEDFVKRHWKLFRQHISLKDIAIEKDDFSEVSLRLPSWLGGRRFVFQFFVPTESDIVVDCINMHMRYKKLKEFSTIE